MQEPTFDKDGYPTEETLKAVREWPCEDFEGLIAFMKRAWQWPEFIQPLPQGGYSFSTGGWSGNEDLMQALEENRPVYFMYWYASLRGGHYEYRKNFAKGSARNPRPFEGWEEK